MSELARVGDELWRAVVVTGVLARRPGWIGHDDEILEVVVRLAGSDRFRGKLITAALALEATRAVVDEIDHDDAW